MTNDKWKMTNEIGEETYMPMPTKKLLCILPLILASTAVLMAQPARRPLKLDDVARLREARDPQISPDGQWVTYVVSTIDVKEDKADSHVWVVSFDGKSERQMTRGPESESSPRWSPDGKYLSFTSSRPGAAKGNQVWLLDRDGGDAFQLTDVKGRLQAYEWSPDSKRLALVIGDPDPEAEAAEAAKESGGKPKAPKPVLIDRYKFKQDGQGYLLSDRHSYIYLFDIETKKLERLTTGKWDEANPSWSPDGTRIAFLSNHAADPDRDPSAQIFVAEAKPGATEKALTRPSVRAGRSRPEWSPDGKWIAFLEGDEIKYGAYNMSHLAIVASIADGDGSVGPRRVESVEALDRSVSLQGFSPDGKSIRFLVTDDRSAYPAQVNLSSGKLERLLAPPIVISSWESAKNRSVVISGGDAKYAEVYAFENGALRQLTRQNDALFT